MPAGERVAHVHAKVGRLELGGHMKTVEEIALAPPEDGGVHREHQPGAPCTLGAPHEVGRDTTVAVDVQLKPEEPRGCCAHSFDGAVGERGQDHAATAGTRGSRRGHFALGGGHLLKGHRGDDHRPIQGVASHLHGQRPVGHIAKDAVAHLNIIPRGARGTEQDLVVGATGVVVVDHARQPFRRRGFVGLQIDQGRHHGTRVPCAMTVGTSGNVPTGRSGLACTALRPFVFLVDPVPT